MLKRTLVFSNPMHLSLKNGQLLMAYKGNPDDTNTVPIEDIGVVLIEHQQISLTAALFRKNLEKDGFIMHQFSVYMRYCASLETAQVHIKSVRNFAPDNGHITIVTITDKQYSNIINIWGAIERKNKPTPLQLEFF